MPLNQLKVMIPETPGADLHPGSCQEEGRAALQIFGNVLCAAPELVFCEWISPSLPKTTARNSRFPSDSDSQHSALHQMMLFSY